MRPAPEPFDVFYVSHMEGREPTPPEWLVDGVIMRGTVILMVGPPKVGKSLLLQQLFTALALGQPWLGRDTLAAKCLALFCEDGQAELERRQTAINTYYDRSPLDFETNFAWQSRIDRDALLVEFERFGDRPKFTPLWEQLLLTVREDEFDVIGVDTAATVFGGNENSRSQTTRFLREWQKLAIEINGAIVLLSHPSRSNPNSYSGVSAWLASVRAGMALGRPSDWSPETDSTRDPRRVLRGLGANYGAGIGVEAIEYQNGVFVTTDDAPAGKKKTNAPLSTIERTDLRYRLLEGLRRVIQNGGKVPADELKPGSLANRARRSPDANINHVALNELYAAQADLIDQGQAVRVMVGRECLIRPTTGPFYQDEQPWLPAAAPQP